MSEPRERELKYRFPGREEFARAVRDRRLGELSRVDSLENHYFDTAEGFLVGRRVMLRLRRADGRFILGLKIGTEARPGFFDSMELEQTIPPGAARRILAGPSEMYLLDAAPVRALAERFGVLELVSLGAVDVERTTKDEGRHRLEFDRLVFPDGSESFELEIETDQPEAVETWLRGVLVDLRIPLEPQRLTKLEQFVAWRRRMSS